MTIATWFVLCCGSVMAAAGGLLSSPAATATIPATRVAEPALVWHVAGEGRGSPAAHAGVVYFLSKRHEVVAVDALTGRVRWTRLTGVSGGETTGFRVLTTPTSVIAGDYDVVCLDHAGRMRWRFTPSRGYGPGLYLGDMRRNLVFAGSPAGRLYAIDIASGAEAWSVRVGRDARTTVFAPVVDDDLVLVGFTSFQPPGSGGVAAYDARTGRERWRRAMPASTIAGGPGGVTGGPVAAAGLVFAANRDGVIYALDRGSGVIRWSLPAVGLGGLGGDVQEDFRALARSGGALVAASLRGTVVSYDVETRRERWRATPSQSSVSFGIAGDAAGVYVPYLTGDLVALDPAAGSERWRTTGAKRGAAWAPLILGDRIYAATSNTGFFAFRRSLEDQ